MDFEQTELWRRVGSDPGFYYIRDAESDREVFRREVERLLHQGKVTVEFVKSDGTVRSMICTLSEDHGAKYNPVTVTEAVTPGRARRRPTDQVRTVWDCDAGAWRSFRWDRLKRIGFTIG